MEVGETPLRAALERFGKRRDNMDNHISGLAQREKKWAMPIKEREAALSLFVLFFGERFPLLCILFAQNCYTGPRLCLPLSYCLLSGDDSGSFGDGSGISGDGSGSFGDDSGVSGDDSGTSGDDSGVSGDIPGTVFGPSGTPEGAFWTLEGTF
jgi:hypothetical protein